MDKKQEILDKIDQLGYSTNKDNEVVKTSLYKELETIRLSETIILIDYRKSSMSRNKITKIAEFSNCLISDIFTNPKNKFKLLK